MFGMSKNELRHEVETLREENSRMLDTVRNSTFLVDIQRIDRDNVFTFVRNGETFTIETMGLISDNVPGWREQAGLK